MKKEQQSRAPALLGSAPLVDTEHRLNIVRPIFPALSTFASEFEAVLTSGVVTNHGPHVQRFERELADYLDVRYCAVFSNGETALITMLKAAKLAGKVITPAYTFCGTVHALRWNGLEPVFADIHPGTLTLDSGSVESRIRPGVCAILAAPLYGNPCDNDALERIAARHGLQLLFDSASGFGSRYGGRRLGGFGRAEIFSFHATKVFPTMEGGALATNDPELYERACRLRNFGMDADGDCYDWGLNGKMTELAAIIGSHGLPNVDEYVVRRNKVSKLYEDGLRDLAGVSFQEVPVGTVSSRLYFPIMIGHEFGLSAPLVIRGLLAENIVARRFLFPAANRLSCYRAQAELSGALPVTDRISGTAVALPVFNDMSDAETTAVVRALRSLHEYRDDVNEAPEPASRVLTVAAASRTVETPRLAHGGPREARE